jgi:3-oxoacyl-[acyl-carrier-protein] synthase III
VPEDSALPESVVMLPRTGVSVELHAIAETASLCNKVVISTKQSLGGTSQFGIVSAEVGLQGQRQADSELSDSLAWTHSSSALDLELEAAQLCLYTASMPAHDIDVVISQSLPPQYLSPGNAGIISKRLGARPEIALNIEAGCAAFHYAIEIGINLANRRSLDNVLISFSFAPTAIIGRRASRYGYRDSGGAVILSAGCDRPIIRDVRIKSFTSYSEFKVLTALTSEASNGWSDAKFQLRTEDDSESVPPLLLADTAAAHMRDMGVSPREVCALLLHQSRLTPLWIKYLTKECDWAPYIFP